MSGPPPPQIFVCYDQADVKWLTRLRVHLKPLERACTIELWDDTRMLAGADWQTELQNAIKTSVAAILLVSPDFMASDLIADETLPLILAEREKRGLRVLPIIVGHSAFARTPSLYRQQP